ncbi:uncharacterized protein LOC131954419 [Physella acuta]|uniref:uncharacterized protein LOC131954419 n=1 Tax=Physella acuta TaxID=109671 RepID=UPI0027DBEBA8|nr:uncharacterized protein LOC131954419 [Physella acuta]
MTTAYAAPSSRFFLSQSKAYDSLDAIVKQEPSENCSDAGRPVDMSVSARYACAQPAPSRCSSFPFPYTSQDNHQQNYDHRSPPGNHQSDSSTPSSPIEPRQSPRSPVSPDYNFKSSRGTLGLPGVMTGNGRIPGMKSMELQTMSAQQRAKREFVPDEKKDEGYWCKRLKNNDSARRSRVKRKALEKLMETRLLELQKENIELKHEMAALKRHFGIEEKTFSYGEFPFAKQGTSPRRSPALDDDKDEDLERQSAGSEDSSSNDDSRVYSMGSVTALNQTLGPAVRYRTNPGSSTTESRGLSIDSRSSRTCDSGCSSLRIDKSGALDLTSDQSERSTPARDTARESSPDTCSSSSSSFRTAAWTLGDQGQADGKHQIMTFPLKCRWKKEMISAHAAMAEEMR